MTQGTIMPISGFLIRYIGPRTAMFSGCIIFSIGTALTHLTINTNLPLVGLTYGFVQAFGQSIALIPTMTIGKTEMHDYVVSSWIASFRPQA